MSASPFSIGVKVLGGGAVLGVAFIVVGYLLPTEFEARAERVAGLSAEEIFRYLDSPEGWRDWTAWPESGLERTGPARGEGARITWNDPELGSGSFTLTSVAPNERVAYRVEVEGTMLTEGTLTLAPEGGGVRMTWVERGAFDRNPLMGWWTLSMDRAQSAELVKGLERLERVAGEGSALSVPMDSIAAAVDGHAH